MRFAVSIFALWLVALAPRIHAEDGSFRVEGQVFNLETRIPLVGAQVDLFHVNPRLYLPEGPTATAYTDANGFYSAKLPVLPDSWYRLESQCSRKRTVGTNESQLGAPGAPPSGVLRRDLYLDVTRRRVLVICQEGGENPPSGPLRWDFGPVEAEGYAFNTLTGAPLAGARIEIFYLLRPQLLQGPPMAVVLTDANGFYSLGPLSPRRISAWQGFRLAGRCAAAASPSGYLLNRGENRRDLYLDVTRRAGPIECEEAADLPPR